MKQDMTPPEAKTFDELSKRIAEVLEGWKVPGLAIGVIRGNEVLYVQGFGQRNVKNGLPVTTNTLFPIASCTKAFTAAAIAMLVEEGKLDWDRPVRKYLPEFEMYDTFATERLSIRDMLSHRSGLPRHDFVWYGNPNLTTSDLVNAFEHLQPSRDFRTAFQYNNLMYGLAGYLIERMSGVPWTRFVHERILSPLHMDSTVFETTQTDNDFALPYMEIDGVVSEIPFYAFRSEVTRPAGAICSNITDMVQWLKANLPGAGLDDARLISPSTLAELHAPIIPSHVYPWRFPEMSSMNYGMGWMIDPYRGHHIIHHGGHINGFSSLVSLAPNDDLGVVVFINKNYTPVPELVTHMVWDALFDLDPIDWSTRYKEAFAKLLEDGKTSRNTVVKGRIESTHPSHPLTDYTGVYMHPGYGTVEVQTDRENLLITRGSMRFHAEHFHYDTFLIQDKPLGITWLVTFSTNPKGKIDSVSIPFEPAVEPIVFVLNQPLQSARDANRH